MSVPLRCYASGDPLFNEPGAPARRRRPDEEHGPPGAGADDAIAAQENETGLEHCARLQGAEDVSKISGVLGAVSPEDYFFQGFGSLGLQVEFGDGYDYARRRRRR